MLPNSTAVSVVVGLHGNVSANSELGFFRKLRLTVLQRFCSRCVMVPTQSFDESGDIPNWTTCCFKAADTTDRVNSRLGECSWRAVKRVTCCRETLADSSYTSQDREFTTCLRTHDNSSGVITARGPDMDSQIANVENIEVKTVALDPHSYSKIAAQLVARPSENIVCDGLLCIGMDRSGELQKVECCFAAVVGLPTPTVIDGGRTHHVASNMARTGAQSANTLGIDGVCCSVDGRVHEAPLLSNHALVDMEPE